MMFKIWAAVLMLMLLSSPVHGFFGLPGSELSEGNSTTTVLAAAATFTGDWEVCYQHSTISVAVTTDLDGTLRIQFSPDGTNADSSLSYDIKAGVIEPPHKLEIFRKYCRVTFTNDGGTTQSYLRLQTIYGYRGVPMAPLNLPINPDADAIVSKTLDTEFLIGTGNLTGVSKINKFGRNSDVDGAEDIWDGGSDVAGGTANYAGFPTGAAETVDVFSSSTNDDEGGSGCEKWHLYGISGTGSFADEVVTLNGTSAVTTVGTYKRVYRGNCTQSANGANTALNAGTITMRHTSTTANVFSITPVGVNQSQVCAMSIPSDKYGYVRDVIVGVNKNNTAVVTGAMVIYDGGAGVGPPRYIRPFTASNSNTHIDHVYSAIYLAPGSDFKVRITAASTTNIDVTCNIDIFFIDTI